MTNQAASSDGVFRRFEPGGLSFAFVQDVVPSGRRGIDRTSSDDADSVGC